MVTGCHKPLKDILTICVDESDMKRCDHPKQFWNKTDGIFCGASLKDFKQANEDWHTYCHDCCVKGGLIW